MDQQTLSSFVMMGLIFAIMYFLLIRPQQKKVKEHKAMIEAIRRNDIVVTQGGIIGKVAKVKDDSELEIEIAEGVKVRVMRATIATVKSKTDPAEA
ncbi:preprotein translocase subunit YajC [Sagittula salina]|uniref:Sec translocon accessory complex subunit YajC n=1 Tax=Sagittula salina TaxID=2820268 RepID=A0A940MRM3_9RHOB|nr:preprotein translocase subunit YajC [Sagittula salina]MBP0481769.1 preprotein translocase subunit YajC [Sagittula salina]